MDQKLNELTNKLLKEGVEKGESEKKAILKSAQEEADKILEKARKTAKGIISEADKKAKELKSNVESELKLTTQQAISTLKQTIVDMLLGGTLDQTISEELSSEETLKKIILSLAESWDGKTSAIALTLPENLGKDIVKAIENDIKKHLKSGLDIDFSKNIKSGFRVGPSDGGFKITFTDEDFSEFLKEFIKPKTKQILFGDK